MPRYPIKRSLSGIYHIMLKGIDGRDIFLDDEDRIKFIENTVKARGKGNFKLHAYCLMDNHVHLLIKENEEIGTSIKRITVGCVQWHNLLIANKGISSNLNTCQGDGVVDNIINNKERLVLIIAFRTSLLQDT